MQNRGSRDGLRLLLMCLKYVLRTQRLVRPVLAFDEYGSGFEAFGVVPLASRDAEAHAIGGGGIGRSAGGGDEAFSDSSGLNVPPVSLSNVPGVSETNVPPISGTNVPGISL